MIDLSETASGRMFSSIWEYNWPVSVSAYKFKAIPFKRFESDSNYRVKIVWKRIPLIHLSVCFLILVSHNHRCYRLFSVVSNITGSQGEVFMTVLYACFFWQNSTIKLPVGWLLFNCYHGLQSKEFSSSHKTLIKKSNQLFNIIAVIACIVLHIFILIF